MEGVGPRGKWKKKTLCSVLLLLCMFIHSFGLPSPQSLEEGSCPPEDYRLDNGICCNKCPSGYKLKKHCPATGQRTECEKCPEGQYLDQLNYTPNCRRCKRCKKVEDEVSPCSIRQNTICRCKEGHYNFPIDSESYECRKCSTCGPGERQIHKCTPEHNIICECEKGYYRAKNKCLPCTNCTSADCSHDCLLISKITTPVQTRDHSLKIVLASVGVIVVAAVTGFITYAVTMYYINRKLQDSSIPPQPSPESTEILIHNKGPTNGEYDTSVPQNLVYELEPTNLPDCIPLEIKIPELIYTVLELVPVTRVKELVRVLGVTDIEIERIEADHRACREAHYQMLRLWAERRSRSGREGGACRSATQGEVLHRPLLQELLDKLEELHLGGVIEELELKYGIQ